MDEPTLSPAASAEPPPPPPVARMPISWQSVVLVVGTIALTVGLAFVPGDFVARLGNYGYLGVFILTLLSSATIVLPSPAVGIVLLAGKTLDPWLVGLVSGVAAGLGEITGYLAGIGGSELAKRSRFYLRIARYVQRWGVLTIFTLAIIPSPVFDMAGIAAGTMRMPFYKFFIACTLGKTIRFIGVASIGHWWLG